MRAPSIKRLCETFGLDRPQAKLVRALAKNVDHPDTLRDIIETHCPATHKYAGSCFNDPFRGKMWRRTMMLHAIDATLGTHGVEALGPVDMHEGPPYEYCNTGDTYAATLIYSRASDCLNIGDWGSIAERNPDW